jgi:hypothetical protein
MCLRLCQPQQNPVIEVIQTHILPYEPVAVDTKLKYRCIALGTNDSHDKYKVTILWENGEKPLDASIYEETITHIFHENTHKYVSKYLAAEREKWMYSIINPKETVCRYTVNGLVYIKFIYKVYEY